MSAEPAVLIFAAAADAPSSRGVAFALGHRKALDGLRGIAVLGVLAVHTTHIFGVPLLRGGSLGVDVFFVLSGFLITSLLVEEWTRSGSVSLINFYRRRALRLVPALTLLLICLVLGARAAFPAAEAEST